MGLLGDNRGMERRRGGQQDLSPLETLRQLPALVVLERLPVATLAIAEDGTIVFANNACAEMLGYGPEELASLRFTDVFQTMPPDESAVAAVRSRANLVVELAHKDGSTVRARMSKSALQRDDDAVALAAFHDLTEELWTDGE
jgi:PAS domain S-box-containing protein